MDEVKFIDTTEFSSIHEDTGTIHFTKNCLKYSLIDIDYMKSRF